MNLMLSTFTEVILPILVLVLGVCIAVFIVVFGKNKFKPNNNHSARVITDAKDISVTPVGSYCDEDTMKFLDSLHMALPAEFIAFPNVGVDRIVTPGKNRVAYNAIMSKYVDVVVFYRKTMQPVLIVDLINPNGTTDDFQTMNADVIAVLKAIKLPIVEIKLEKAYNIESLRHALIHSIPDKILAEITMSAKIDETCDYQ